MTRAKEFERLAAVAKLVLVLPHANADAERVFSVVGLNKTKRRDSLALDGTLSSIMTIKMANLEPCLKWEPPSDIIKASKKATGQYNHAHRSYTRTLPSFWSASDTDYASFFVIFVMHSSVLLLEKGVLFMHFICCTLFVSDGPCSGRLWMKNNVPP